MKKVVIRFVSWIMVLIFVFASAGIQSIAHTVSQNEIADNLEEIEMDMEEVNSSSYLERIDSKTYGLSNPTIVDRVNTWDCIYFGRYPQTDKTGEIKDPIKWRVLQVENGKAFLLADKNLDAQKYHSELADITWEKCSLRTWLNNDFMDVAFTDREKESILTTVVENHDYPYSRDGAKGGNSTNDKIFLLSVNEILSTKYGFNDAGNWIRKWYAVCRKAENTSYATQCVSQRGGNSNCYWLRTPDADQNTAFVVAWEGCKRNDLDSKVNLSYAIRPAMWIDLNDTSLWNYAGKVSCDGASFTYTTGEEAPEIQGELSALEKELIDKVSLYTSDGGKSYLLQLNRIIDFMNENNCTQEQKLHILNSFHVQQGFSDPQEGISYCRDAINARKAYDYLVESDCFTAHQYWYWLNFEEDGKAARGVLWADKFIFDNQIDQYFEPSTYITGETDSIKGYKELLLKFISYDEAKYEMLSFGKTLKTAMEGAVDTTNDTYLQHYLKKMEECTSTEEMEEVFADYMKQIEPEIDKEGSKIVFNLKGCKEINKLIDVSGELLTVATDVTDDIVNLMLLETKLETINHYDVFLQDIIDGKDMLPRDMVIAAYQLKQESFQPYTEQLITILGQLADHYADGVYDIKAFCKDKIGEKIAVHNPQLSGMKGVPLGDAIATIKLGAFCVDHLLGVNKLLDNSRDVEAYAYLGMYYSTLLIERKEAFLKDKTVSNAWKFYDTYQLLFDIRGQGEKAYYEMSQMDGIVGTIIKCTGWNFFRVNDKKAYLEETLDYLNNYCAFNLENAADIVGDHFYTRKLVVSCPVDVQILDKNGALLYEIKDGEEGTQEVEFGKLVCQYIPKTADYEKVIYFTKEPDYIIKVVGVGEGVVDIKTAAKTGEEVIVSQSKQISIEKGGVIIVDVENAECQVDADGDGEKEQVIPMVEMSDEFVLVERVALSESDVSLHVGEKKKLKAVLVPENATFGNVSWSSSNQEIVEVNNGVLQAKKQGEAIIYAEADKCVAECKVMVKQPVEGIKISKDKVRMSVGDKMTLEYEVLPKDASDQNVIWDSGNEKVAVVDAGGKISAVGVGETTILIQSCDNSNIFQEISVVVSKKQIPVSKIKIKGISKKIAARKSIQLKASITPKTASEKGVTWKSSNKKYATVSSRGKVKLKKAGAGKTVTITAIARDGSGVKATYKIKIMEHRVKSIKLNVSKQTVKAGKKLKVTAKIKTTGKKANKKLKWASSNEKYATVTSEGIVKTKKAGKGKTVVITAMAIDGSGKKAKIKIRIR